MLRTPMRSVILPRSPGQVRLPLVLPVALIPVLYSSGDDGPAGLTRDWNGALILTRAALAFGGRHSVVSCVGRCDRVPGGRRVGPGWIQVVSTGGRIAWSPRAPRVAIAVSNVGIAVGIRMLFLPADLLSASAREHGLHDFVIRLTPAPPSSPARRQRRRRDHALDGLLQQEPSSTRAARLNSLGRSLRPARYCLGAVITQIVMIAVVVRGPRRWSNHRGQSLNQYWSIANSLTPFWPP